MRRPCLPSLTVLLAGVLMLAACGGSDPSTSSTPGSAGASSAGPTEASGAASTSSSPSGRLAVGYQFLDEFAAQTVAGLQTPPAYGSVPAALLFNGLMKLNPSKGYQPEPDLAERVDVSADGLTYTFALRQGVTWHDGTPFTAKDVVFTLSAVRDPANKARTAADLAAVTLVEAPDDRTVVVRLTSPFAPILQSLSLAIHPAHLLGAEMAAGTPYAKSTYATAPVGTGPYRWGEYRQGEQLILEANASYHRGAPGIAEVVLVAVADYDAAAARLAAGEIDIAEVQGAQLPLIDKLDEYRVNTVPSTNVYAIALNVSDPMLADVRVRIALNRLVDRQALLDTLEAGKGTAALTPLVNTSVAIDPGTSLASDPAGGAALLTEAGWSRSGSGPWTKDGRTLSLTLHDGFAPKMAEIVATAWRDNGIEVKVVADDYSKIFGELFADASKFQAITYSFGSPADPDGVSIVFDSAAGLAQGGFNAFGYRNAAVDAALAQGRTSNDTAVRTSAYAAFQKAAIADPAYVFLYTSPVHIVISDDVTGWTPGIVEYQFVRFFYWNIETWRTR